MALHFGIFETACLLEVAKEDAILLHSHSEMGEESAMAPLFGQIEMIEEAILALQLYLIEKAALALHLSSTLEPQDSLTLRLQSDIVSSRF